MINVTSISMVIKGNTELIDSKMVVDIDLAINQDGSYSSSFHGYKDNFSLSGSLENGVISYSVNDGIVTDEDMTRLQGDIVDLYNKHKSTSEGDEDNTPTDPDGEVAA